MRSAILITLALLAACKGRQTATTPVGPVDPVVARPSWVQSRPVDAYNYIGIGLCPKSRPDHQETAKKNALNDLASEISVKVEGNSLLYTLDRKNQFDEQFTSTINTRTSEQLEGFELVDSWDNGSEYWTYYRLSKAEHARIKAEKKRQALAQATDLFARSKGSLASGDLRSAFDQDLRALMAMKAYWGESDMAEVNGEQVPLANAIYDDLLRMASGVRIAILPERCELDYAKHFERELLISAEFLGGRTLNQIPLTISWPGAAGPVAENKSTDNEGRLRTTVSNLDLEAPSPEVVVRLAMDALVSKDLDQAFVKPLLASMNVPERRAPIDLRMPRIHMQAIEKNMGQTVVEAGLAVAIREELSRRGFRFVDRPAEADMLMLLNASTREGGNSNGFYTAYLDVSFSFRDRLTNEVIYEGGRQAVKGVQLTYEKAGLDAYRKAVQEMKRDLVPAMLNALL